MSVMPKMENCLSYAGMKSGEYAGTEVIPFGAGMIRGNMKKWALKPASILQMKDIFPHIIFLKTERELHAILQDM